MQTFFIPEEQFTSFIKEKGIGKDARFEGIDGKLRWIVKIEAGEYIIRPIPKVVAPKTLLAKIMSLL